MPSLYKWLLVCLLPLLAASTPIDSNTLDRGDGVYVHNKDGQIIDFVPIAELHSKNTNTNASIVPEETSSLEERKLAFEMKCFKATFDTNDKRVGLQDLGDIMDRYKTLEGGGSLVYTYYTAVLYACNYSTSRINLSRGTSNKVHSNLDSKCGSNTAARGDYKSGLSYGRTKKGKPYCN
ncbi:hypothetical protein F5B20DRAFT_918 [Whalleya microplaca]|nr:hypothetical protein F5B20DRAFT_918 [Whalleya microplaca]